VNTNGSEQAQIPDLSTFWLANGFERMPVPCILLSPAERRDTSQELVSCWERWYRGRLTQFSGALFARELWEGGVFVVYIYSNHRELEASAVVENLELYLGSQFPEVEVRYDEKWFVDTR